MSTLMFYQKPIAINSDTHRDVKIAPIGNDYSFANETNSIVVSAVEFLECSKEYPIVFAPLGANAFAPAVLVGVRNNENLFLKEDGSWDGRYVPAFVRRYPFVVADAGNEQLLVRVDENYEGFNAENGERLFEEDGASTPLMQNAVNFLQAYQNEMIQTDSFAKKLVELDLMKEMNMRIDADGGKSFVLQGFSVVDEQKLLALPNEAVDELFKKGWLALIYAHLISISNVSRLLDMLVAKMSTEKTKEA